MSAGDCMKYRIGLFTPFLQQKEAIRVSLLFINQDKNFWVSKYFIVAFTCLLW